jgi:hypothetical protein
MFSACGEAVLQPYRNVLPLAVQTEAVQFLTAFEFLSRNIGADVPPTFEAQRGDFWHIVGYGKR